MLPEFGQLVLILATMVAVLQCIFGFVGAQTRRREWMAVVRPAAWVQTGLLVSAFGLLLHAFITHDRTVQAVADYTTAQLPLAYSIAAIWASPQGSLLLWAIVLAAWSVCALRQQTLLPDVVIARIGATLGALSSGCLAYVLSQSNPFGRIWPLAQSGAGLDPLLQNPLMMVHPPILYAGYVGTAVPFAFAVAVLLTARLEPRWLMWLRPYCVGSWALLTIGIALGSWWAYRVLGWGGWWFWDPVENISLMPWLIGAALIHSLALGHMQSRSARLTLLLSLGQFCLVVLGTVLVRSGELLSVHAFAAAPQTTHTLVIVILLIGCAAATLFCYASPRLRLDTPSPAPVFSRDTALLINTLMMVSAFAMVFLGTVYPLLARALGMGMISVGPPYFATLVTFLMAPVAAILPFGPAINPSASPWCVLRSLAPWLTIASCGALLTIWLFPRNSVSNAAGVAGVLWILGATLQWTWTQWRSYRQRPHLTAFGMSLAHCGVGVFIAGALLVGTQSIHHERALALGQNLTVGPYRLRLLAVTHASGPNYWTERFRLRVFNQTTAIGAIVAERRHYTRELTITEPGIYMAGWADVYILMGEPLGQQTWAVRVYYKPFVRLIWIGMGLMGGGGAISAMARLTRRHASLTNPAQ